MALGMESARTADTDGGPHNECGAISIDERDRRALEQYLTVTPEISRARGAEGLVIVTSQSGREYFVDVHEGACQRKDGSLCPDQEYNLDENENCKHVKRARYALGIKAIPVAAMRELDIDPDLGRHTDAELRFVAPDGGTVAVEADDVQDAGDGRPADCDCLRADSEMPCWPCYREGFETSNPNAGGGSCA